MDVLHEKDVCIRKQHQCLMCLRIFDKGIIMHSQTVRDDDIYTVYTCMDCESIKHKIETIDGVYEEGCVLNEMSEYSFHGTVEDFIEFLKKRKPPTGVTSILSEQSSGIHPIFSTNYKRRI